MFTRQRKPVLVFRISLAFVLIIVFAVPPMMPTHAAGITAYVAPSGMTTGSCASWANACDLQHALHIAAPGYVLWVKGGTYYPTDSTDRTVSFILKNGVALYGGFAGTEDLLSERDPSTNVTILSGDIGVVNNPSDNSYHVVAGGGTNNTAILDGFTIQGGNADGSDPNDRGGGMYNQRSSPTLTNIAFNDNSAIIVGGGVYNFRSHPTLTNVTFSRNSADNGGGMYNTAVSSPTLTDVTFHGNSATSGGGLYNEASYPTLTNVIFSGNSANDGGGMYNIHSSNPTLTDVTFRDNFANTDGGGMYNLFLSNSTLTDVTFSDNSAANRGGGVFNDTSSPILTDVIFNNNFAAISGGGMINLSSNPTLTNVTFMGNSVSAYGGGMLNFSSSPTLTSVTFNNNSAADSGGGMANENSNPALTDVTFSLNSANNSGGGVFNLSSSPTLINVSINSSTARYGGGMNNESSNPTLTGVTFNSNSADVYGGGMLNVVSNPTLTDVMFSNNSAADSGGGMVNDISSSPLLTNVTFNANSATYVGGGIYNIRNNSPTLTNVTFNDNSAAGGGGMYNETSSLILTNVTFNANSADDGGGMYNLLSLPLLTNVTFSANSADRGGGVYNSRSHPTFTNVILWGNGSEIYNESSTPTIAYSVVQGSGGSGDSWNIDLGIDGGGNLEIDPLLSPLANNGGFTQTMALSADSPAIDAGDDASCPATDQRGVTRPSGSHCDIGAYEYDISIPLPAPWVGGVSITSNKNVVAIGRPHIGSEVASYDGFSSGSLTAYVPMLFKGTFGSSYDSALYVQNVHASNTASITIKYYDSNGVLSCTKADTIAALSSKGYWVPSVLCDSGSLPMDWVGGAVVTSDQPIVAVGRPHVGGEVMTYDGFASGSLTSYIPMLFKGAFGGSYNAAFYLQNTHDTNTTNITIKYYDSSGLLNCTKADMIAPLASKGYWVPEATCDSGSLPLGWVGGVVVTSDQPIVAVGRPHIGSQVTTYNGFPAGSLSSYVPMLFKSAFGGSYNAAFYLQNTHTSNTASVTIKYYDSSGLLNCTKTDTIAPLASKGYWVPGATCDTGSLPAGWVGGVVVTSDQPLVAVGRPHLDTQVTTYNGFTNGSLNAYLPMLFKAAFGGTYNAAFYVQNTENSAATVTIKFYDTDGNLACTITDTLSALASKGYWLPTLKCVP